MMVRRFVMIGAWCLLAALGLSEVRGEALTTAFTYQGELRSGGALANGAFDLEVRVFDDAAVGTELGLVVVEDVPVSGGLFAVELDFGAGVFNGERRWLEIGVRDGASTGSFETLSPRHEVTAPPAGLGSAYRMGRTIDLADGPIEFTGTGLLGDGVKFFEPGGLRTFQFTTDDFGRGASVQMYNGLGTRTHVLSTDSDASGGAFLLMTRNDEFDTGFFIDGNRFNTQAPSMTIMGPDRSATLDMSVSGDDSVMLPVDAIERSEILDEPGVAAVGDGNSEPLTILDSQSITVPNDGYVLVIGSLEFSISHSMGSTSSVEVAVSDDPNTLPANLDLSIALPASLATGFYTFPGTVHGLFPVSAGSHTFWLRVTPGSGTSAVGRDRQLTLVYLPTAYGSVGLTTARAGDPAQQRAASVAANEARIEREMAEMRAELERLRERVDREIAAQGLARDGER